MTGIKKKSFFDFGNPLLLALVIAIVSFLVYANTIPNNYNIDDELVTDNHALKNTDFSTLVKLFSEPYYQDAAGNKYEYRPMVMVSFFFEFLLFGKNPHVSHFINLIIYSINCILVFYLLLSLFDGLKNKMPFAFAVALFFAVHPLHTEAVASIKSRDELLSMVFGTAAWISVVNFADRKSLLSYFLYLVFFLAALFSKQTTITFSILIPASIVVFRKISFSRFLALIVPITLIASFFSPIYLLVKKAMVFVFSVIFLLVFYFLIDRKGNAVSFVIRIGKGVKKIFICKINFTRVSGVVVLLAAIFLFGYLIITRNDKAAQTLKEAQYNVSDKIHDFNELQVTPFLETPAPSVIPIAGRKLDFVETPLVYVHDFNEKLGTSIYALGVYLKLIFVPYPLSFYYGYKQIPITGLGNFFVILSLLVHAAMVAAMLYFFFRQKHLIAAFGLLFYIVAIIPLSNLLTPIAGVVAERLSYSASLGYCVMFCYWILYPLIDENANYLKWSGQKAAYYSKVFFAIIILVFAGMTFARNFSWKDHLTLFRHDIVHLDNSARAHHLLGSHLAYSTIGNPKSPESVKKLQEAIPHFKKTIEIYPNFPYAWFDLAKTYLLLGDKNNAINAYINSTKNDTLVAPPFFELGVVLSEADRQQEAEEAYRKAIGRDSTFMQAYTNLSYLYYMQERYQESIAVNRLAVHHKPAAYEPLVNLGRTYLKIRDLDNALLYFEKAAAVNHSDKSLTDMIADLYQNKGDMTKAQYYRNLK